MSSILGKKPFSTPKNINLKKGLLRFGERQTANHFGTLDYGIYVNSSDQLVFSSLGSATILGSAGGGGSVPSYEQIFGGDQVFVTTGTTFTIRDAGTGANDILTVEATAGMTGDIIKINNAGTGKDISGAGDTWSITKAGAAVLTDLDTPLITSTAALTIAVDGASAITLGTGVNTITLAGASSFSSTVALAGAVTQTNSSMILTSNSNTVAPLLITDNTITTYGTAASEGVAVLRSTSLTTGSLLKLQLAGLAQTTGYYLECYDTTDTNKKFTIGEDGATVILGAAYATAALTVSNGDLIISEGKITHTAVGATTTGGFLGTYAGLTTGYGMSLIHTTSVIASGGSLLRLTSTGTNTGTTTGVLLDLADASVAGTKILGTFGTTTGVAMSLVTAITTGTALSLTSSGIITTNGEMLLITADSATTSTGLVRISGNGLTSGTGISLSVTGLVDGNGLYIAATEATLTTGKYINCYDGAASDFTVGRYGATVIAGVAATNVLTITAGHALLTSGNLTLTSGNIVQTSGNLTLTAGNLLLTAGTLTLTSGDATLTDGDLILTANASVISFTGTGANGGKLKNLKNAAATALTGTQKDIEIDIAGVPYYFTVYPTKGA